jgi:hypothetical protein
MLTSCFPIVEAHVPMDDIPIIQVWAVPRKCQAELDNSLVLGPVFRYCPIVFTLFFVVLETWLKSLDCIKLSSFDSVALSPRSTLPMTDIQHKIIPKRSS